MILRYEEKHVFCARRERTCFKIVFEHICDYGEGGRQYVRDFSAGNGGLDR